MEDNLTPFSLLCPGQGEEAAGAHRHGRGQVPHDFHHVHSVYHCDEVLKPFFITASLAEETLAAALTARAAGASPFAAAQVRKTCRPLVPP
jgi:hypothetical protein